MSDSRPVGQAPAEGELPPPAELLAVGATTKIELTVAGHTVAVEGAETANELATLALSLFRETAGYAQRSTIGFAAGAAETSLAPPGESNWAD
ncbi:MAG: hypothetical protein ABWY93_18545 [Mycobacterium sp.]